MSRLASVFMLSSIHSLAATRSGRLQSSTTGAKLSLWWPVGGCNVCVCVGGGAAGGVRVFMCVRG